MGKFRWSQDLGVDLGTANTLVFVQGKGIVLKEPTVVAINTETYKVEAVGRSAKNMIGRTPQNISVIRPMKDGVIADYDVTATMMVYFIKKAKKMRSIVAKKPSVMICVPSGITMVEERAVIDATKQAGAKEAFPIAEPFAAAIGSGLPVWEPKGSMIVDIGGGTTEVAVISLGGIVTSRSIRTAGNNMDDAIIAYVRSHHHLLIGERTAESIKTNIGIAGNKHENNNMDIRGRDLMTGLPKIVTITSQEVAVSLKNAVEVIVQAIKDTLEKTPPELSADVIDRGIVLTGGGALLKNFEKVISDETQMPVFITENPLESPANGTGESLEYLDYFQNNPKVSTRSTVE